MKCSRECGPQPLRLSYTAGARRKLRALVSVAPISVQELADVIGVEYKTLVNHLGGRRMTQCRRAWYHRVDRIELWGTDEVHVIVRYRPTRKRWGWTGWKPRLTSGRRVPYVAGKLET